MNESQIDLAHAVALGSIGDEDQRATADLLDSGNASVRADFVKEVQLTREALAEFTAAVAVAPPTSLRDRVLAAVAADAAPAVGHPRGPVHPSGGSALHTGRYGA